MLRKHDAIPAAVAAGIAKKEATEMRKTDARKTIVQVVCAALIFLLIVAFSGFVLFCLEKINSSEYEGTDAVFSREAFGVMGLIWFVLIFYTISFLALSYDPVLRQASILDENRLSKRIVRVVSTPSFWCELAVILLLLFVLPSGFYRVTGVFRIASYPAVAVTFFLVHVAVVSRWNARVGKEETLRPRDIVKAILGRVVLVSASLIVLPPVLLLAYMYLRVLTLFWNIAFAVVLAALILGLLLGKYLRAVGKRKKMLKRLKRICDEKEFSLYCKNVYRSILFAYEEPEITIETGKATYACKLLCTRSKKTPLYILKNGTAVADHQFKIGRITLFHHMVETRFAFESTGRKFLILVPAPVFVYGTDGGRRSDLYDSARVGDYTIFSSSAFLHALDLDALDEPERKREW